MRYSAGFALWFPATRRALHGVPLVLEVNSLGSQRSRWLRPVDRRALRSADQIVCVSEALREFILGLAPELSDRISVVPNGVDVSRFEPGAASPREDGTLHLAFAGLLKPDYGLETLIDAFVLARREHPHLRLHIYGDGPLRGELQRRIDALGEAHDGTVELHQPVPFLEMPQVLTGMDLLVYTTTHKYRFQSPVKLLEYMAAGRPIIAADTPQVRELLRNGELGVLFEAGDAPSLAAAISRVVSDLKQAGARAAGARADVEAFHSWRRRLDGLLRDLGVSVPGPAASGIDRMDAGELEIGR